MPNKITIHCNENRYVYAQITIQINGGETNVYTCPGDSVELNAVITGGQPPYSFEWSPSTGLSKTIPFATIAC